jgi:serine/threonine protein kinase
MTARGTKNADRRGDIYQLGKMLYKILTGENPILIETRALPSALTYIISKATKDNPDDRFQNVSELMDAVNNYIASLQVESNPIKSYESHIKTSKYLLNQEKYDQSVIKEILRILYSSKDNEVQFFEFFDKIPLELIKKMVSDFKEEFNQVFHEYTEKMFDYISNNHLGFAYVETIAKLMRVIYQTSSDVNIKKDALKNNLTSSVYYNRYYAMDIFDELLLSIKDEKEAKVIALMLIEEKKWFEERIEVLPYKDIHTEIQGVIDFIMEEKKIEEKPFSFDDL